MKISKHPMEVFRRHFRSLFWLTVRIHSPLKEPHWTSSLISLSLTVDITGQAFLSHQKNGISYSICFKRIRNTLKNYKGCILTLVQVTMVTLLQKLSKD